MSPGTSVVVAVCALVACGDNLPGHPDRGVARIAVTAPATSATASIPIHLDITGDASSDRLSIEVVEPGEAGAADLPRFLAAGAAPATGLGSYLAADGTWTREPGIAATAPATQDLVLALPSDARGEWLIVARLIDTDGGIDAVRTSSVLVSAEPAIMLSLGDVWAPVDRPVVATTRIARGGRDDLGIVAWLTLPDGSELSLPDLQPGLDPTLARIRGDNLPLLDRALGIYGPGDYGLGVRLVDLTSGTVLGAASAGFTVCDASGQLAGTVRDENGAPLGAGASFATLELASLDDPSITARATVGGDGSYSLDLPVGRWEVHGSIVDGAGSHDIDMQPITVGCVATATLDLVAQPPVAAAPAPRPRHPYIAPAAPGACGPNPILVVVKTDTLSWPQSMSKEAIDPFTRKVTREARDDTDRSEIIFSGQPELEATLGRAAEHQRLGCDTPNACSADVALMSSVDRTLVRMDFILEVSIVLPDPQVDRYHLRLTIVTAHDAAFIKFEEAFAKLSEIDDAIVHTTASLMIGAVQDLREHMRPIRNARFALSTDPAAPIAGQMVAFSAVLTDAQSCRLAPAGTPVTLEELANTPPLVETGDVPTDRAGVAKASAVAPATTRVGLFRATYTYDDGSVHPESLVVLFQPPAGNGLRLSADKVRLGVGDVAHGLAVFPNHPNTMLLVQGTRGSVDQSMIMTDGGGRASFTFTATSSGMANVEVKTMPAFATDDADSNVGFWVDAPLSIALSTPMHTLHTNTLAPVLAKVTLSGDRPAIGIPIQFDITSGSGALSTNVVTTNSDGEAAVVFTAPNSGGTTEITASGSLATARAQDVLAIEIIPPCPTCPIIITTDKPVVAKNGTSHFHANQLVTWSVNSGSINGNGVYTAGTAGGVWTVTATSLENPGQTGTLDFIVECSDSELGLAHNATPQNPLGGGKSYNIHETVTNATGCAPNGTYDGVLHIYTRPSPTSTTVDVAQEIVPPTCDSLLFGFGATAPGDIPAIQACHVHQLTQVAGCNVDSIDISVVGPGISGVTGTLHEGHYDPATTTCSTLHDVDFVSF